MIRFKGFVVVKDGKFFTSQGTFDKDLSKAKDFNSKGTARKVAKKENGYIRELDYSLERESVKPKKI